MIREHTLKYLGVKRGHLYNLSQMFQKTEERGKEGESCVKGVHGFLILPCNFPVSLKLYYKQVKYFHHLKRDNSL